MKYKYFLNNVLLEDEPLGWDELTNKIERVDGIKGLFVTMEVTLTFYGDAWRTLITSFGNSYCEQNTILIQESCDDGITYTDCYEGIIFTSDCVFDYNRCTVSAKVQDNSFYAKINNNKGIKTYVEVGKSKNGVTYTGAIDYKIVLFDCCANEGTYIGSRFPHAVTVYEAFKSLIAFMTDDTVDFASTLFEPGGEYEGYCITDGLHISSTIAGEYSATTNIEKICFQDLFSEMNKKFNLGMMVIGGGTKPILIIEKQSIFSNATSLITLNNVSNVKASIDVNSLFSQVHLGSDTIDGTGCPGGLAFPRDSPFVTYKDESYYVLGTCNIDKTLDLFSQWQIDTNKIQDCVVNGSTDYDKDIFILETTYMYPFDSECVQGNPFGELALSPRFYNASLMNSAVTPRYLGAVPNSIAQVLAGINDTCLILRTQLDVIKVSAPTTNIATYEPVQFNDKTTPPFNDPGGNFTLVNGRYTAVTVGGFYRFESEFDIEYVFNNTTVAPTTATITITFLHKDVANNPLNDTKVIFTETMEDGVFPISSKVYTYKAQSQMFSMAIGDYVHIAITVQWNNVLSNVDNFLYAQVKRGLFNTLYTSNGGGEVTAYDPDKYPAYQFEFEYPMSKDDFQLLLDQPNYAITLNTDGVNNFKGFIKEAKYKRKTGLAQFTLIKPKTID
jgi:hypothetical protein